ncbi:MAG: hypothetical protein MJE66_02705 [Proteobacteria bacterium]|nr:hypothetical protein [Pseudomonadota bacterium]
MRVPKATSPIPLVLVTAWALVALGCASPHYGYRLATERDQPESEVALLVHVPQPYPVLIHAIDGRASRAAIRTSSKKVTYIELAPGPHHLFVTMGQGRGPMRGCDNLIQMTTPAVVSFEAEAGRSYLLQRDSDLDRLAQCSMNYNEFTVHFSVDPMPPTTFESIRDSFEPVVLENLSWYRGGEDPQLDAVIQNYRAEAVAAPGS